VYRPTESWQFNGNISTGFRMPNIDDAGKVFESAPGNITVPNPNLESEYAWNFELGLVKTLNKKNRLELNAFYTILNNAIVRRPTTFNGQDSILFDGALSQVESLQNVAKATVWGIQLAADLALSRNLSLQVNANLIQGRETDDRADEQVPLRHAPPFYGNANLRYRAGKFFAELSGFYNAQVSNADLAPSEQAKTDIYAKDANGNPYSPSWYTVNLRTSYALTTYLTINAGWENLTNQRYRPYSSGVVAVGSNFVFSVKGHLTVTSKYREFPTARNLPRWLMCCKQMFYRYSGEYCRTIVTLSKAGPERDIAENTACLEDAGLAPHLFLTQHFKIEFVLNYRKSTLIS
jgi:hemoglobin/transferrin/lactoferrin receptor protein